MEIFKNEGCTYYSGKYKITTEAVTFKEKVFKTTFLTNPSNNGTSARYFLTCWLTSSVLATAIDVKSEVLTVLLLKIQVVWDVIWHWLVNNYWHFEGQHYHSSSRSNSPRRRQTTNFEINTIANFQHWVWTCYKLWQLCTITSIAYHIYF